MSRASKARKIATVAAYGGGGIGALGAVGGAALFGLMFGETKLARRRIPIAETDPPNSDNTIWAAAGVSTSRPPIRIALLGDSTAAGYGVHRERDTPGAQLAIGISGAARRPVHVTTVAVVGAETHELAEQLDRLESRPRPELAVIMIGANDVTEGRRPGGPVRLLEAAVGRLHASGIDVVVGTCPDLGTIRPLPQPLRWYARHLSRQMAAAQTIAVVRAGGRTVSLGDLLGPLFATHREMFADDQFHPSAAGYAEAATALLPSALDALGLHTRARSASTFTTRRPKSVEKAAAQAAARPGSEVSGAERAGHRGRRPAAQLRRRRAQRPAVASPEAATAVTPPTGD
ncbi:MAG: SGNH/GDSL hydrolase family protein [Jatrophihabitantaceae bacterium]